MKIAQITTSINGGAGLAAKRLSQALTHVGLDSRVVTQRSEVNETSVKSKIVTVLQDRFVQSGPELVTTFSKTLINQDVLSSFEIIHFHGTYNLINTKDLIELSKVRKVVLTLHDQRMITGGCHYSKDCYQFRSSCEKCPQARMPFQYFVHKERERTKALLRSRNLHIVSPSNWLAQLATSTSGLGNPVKVIHNPVPELDFPVMVNEDVRIARNQGKYIIGFVSAHLNNPFKGTQDLIQAFRRLPTEVLKQVHLVIVGKGEVPHGLDFIAKTVISNFDEDTQSNPYKLMDLLVVPSREDNSPNVIGEALMSNVKILGSLSGGIPEILELFGCPVVDTTDPAKFAEKLIMEINQKQIENYYPLARETFGYESIGNQMSEFYESCL